jgi:hypothetical protein
LSSARVALDDQGESFVIAHFPGSVDFGGGPVQTGDVSGLLAGMVYARIDENGNHIESRGVGNTCPTTDITTGHVALLEDRSAILTLATSGKLELGGVTMEGECGEYKTNLVKLEPGGTLGWATKTADTIVADTNAAGTTYTAGSWETNDLVDTYSPDGLPLSTPYVTSFGVIGIAAVPGGGAIVLEDPTWTPEGKCQLLRLSKEGTVLWKRSLPGDITGGIVGADGSGNAYFATTTSSSVDFGTGLLEGGAIDIVVAKFSAADGKTLSAFRSRREPSDPDGGFGYYYSMAVSSAGEIILAGGFTGTIDFGHGPLVSAGANDIFVVKLDL